MSAISLRELSDYLSEVLAAECAETYWIRAEIASLNVRSGHGYFELVEKSANGTLQAKARATCWSSMYGMLQAYFKEETGMVLQAGMQVLLEVEVTYHAVYGLSLNIVGIDPQYTIGDMQRQRELIIKRLQDEGVFDMQRSLVLPTLVRRIAIVSSEQAAGYEDFIHQLHASPYAFTTTLYPAVVQGDGAERSIVKALDTICERQDEYDVVVIIRGGGAVTDLGCFDNYEIAAHCAQFPLPILTGIGHTKDVSITDMVVLMALKTPTAVATFLIDHMSQQKEVIDRLRQQLKMTAERQILIRKHQLELLGQRIEMCNPERIYKMGYSLTLVNGKVLRHVADVQTGQVMTTYVQDGEIEAVVSNVK